MRVVRSTLIFAIITMTLSQIGNVAIAQNKQQQWVEFGKTSNGERLRLDLNSIRFEMMPVDDTINMEGRDGTEPDNIPRHRVVFFNYTIGGRNRLAYTISCQGKNLRTNPSWRTSTSFIDYWPQYFSVAADTNASKKMLKQVCVTSASK